MNLENPVTAIRKTYKHLNDRRICNLLSKRGKFVENKFSVGQFVLINDESQLTAECRGKLNIPHQSLLYKILEIHKDGFSCRLLDILDGSKKEVLCSRLTNLSLEVLEEYNFSTPQFYKNLQKLTDQARNCYEAPTARNTGLKLLQTGSVPETGPGGPDPIVQPGVAPHNHWVDPHNHWTDDRATNFTQDPAD